MNAYNEMGWDYESGDTDRSSDPPVPVPRQVDLFGYATQHFDMCPGAVVEFKRVAMLLNRQTSQSAGGTAYGRNVTEVRSAMKLVDWALGAEKHAIKAGCHTAAELSEMRKSFDGARGRLNSILPDEGPWVGYAGIHLDTVAQLPQCPTSIVANGMPVVKAGLGQMLPKIDTPVWIAFGIGAASGWFARGRLMWLLGAAGLVWWLNRQRTNENKPEITQA